MKTIKIKPVDSQQLSYRTKLALISIIRENGKDGKPFKLPNEDELASKLNVSRNVLRDVLMSLEEMGIVTRRRSKGTIASPYIANAACRLDTDPVFSQMLKHAGYESKVKTLFFGFVNDEATEPTGELLNLVSKKLFYADGVPVAYIIDRFLNKTDLKDEDIARLSELSHKEILEQVYDTPYAYALAHIDAILPDKEVSQYLEIDPMTPVVYLRDQGFNFDHELIVVTSTYIRSGTLDLKVLRKSW